MTQALLAVVVRSESEEDAVETARETVERTLVDTRGDDDRFPEGVGGGIGFYYAEPPADLPTEPDARREVLATFREKPWRREEYSEWRADRLSDEEGRESLREKFEQQGEVYVYDAINGSHEPPTPVTTEVGIESLLAHAGDDEWAVPISTKY